MPDVTLTVDGTDDQPNKKFVTLAAAIAYGQANYPDCRPTTGFDGLLNIVIERDGTDTAQVSVSGFSTDLDHYVNIYAAADIMPTVPAWDTGLYRLQQTLGYKTPLTLVSPYTRVTGLQIGSFYTGTSGYGAVAASSGVGQILDRCILRCDTGSTLGTAAVARGAYAGAHLTLRNCVLYGAGHSPGLYTITGTTIVAENCTIYLPQATYGVWKAAGAISLTNCYVGGAATCLYLSPTQTKVATADATASDPTLRNIAASTTSGAYFSNLAPGTEDFSIGQYSELVDKGNDLSATFPHDLTGAIRSGVWDIGCHEYVIAAQYARPNADIADGGWKRWAGTPLVEQDNVDNYSAIDDVVADDTNVVRSSASPVNDTLTVGLSTINPPAAGPVILRVRARQVP